MKKNNVFLCKIWWICKISILIVLGDALLFWTYNLSLQRGSDVENLSGVIGIYLLSKYIISFFSFYYIVMMAGIGLVCMHQWNHKLEKSLFPLKNKFIMGLCIPGLLYVVFLVIFVHDSLWTGIFAMLCYLAANYFSAIWFNNAYNAYQSQNQEI